MRKLTFETVPLKIAEKVLEKELAESEDAIEKEPDPKPVARKLRHE